MAKEVDRKRKIENSASPSSKRTKTAKSPEASRLKRASRADADQRLATSTNPAGDTNNEELNGSPRVIVPLVSNVTFQTASQAVNGEITSAATVDSNGMRSGEKRKQRRKAQPEASIAPASVDGDQQRPGQVSDSEITGSQVTQARLSHTAIEDGAQDHLSARRPQAEVSSRPTWNMSPPTAGRFIDHDPLFVTDQDGNDLIVSATKNQVQLLLVDSSLIINKIDVPEGRSVKCFARSAAAAHCIDIALDNGGRLRWNWQDSSFDESNFPGQEHVLSMATTTGSQESPAESWYMTRSVSGSSIICGRQLVLETAAHLRCLLVTAEAEYIVAFSSSLLVVGMRKDTSADNYVWLEFPAQSPLTTVDARIVYQRNKQKRKSLPDCVIAVGDHRGKIHLISSVLSLFGSEVASSLSQARTLHWHREPVSALKFSRDGNYLISGGLETVLVLWQLETGKQQFLPHLTADIERIVVSPNGSQYALQMGDNSIMVLSTSELKPVAHFSGLQFPASAPPQVEALETVIPKMAVALHPQRSGQILLSVPSTQPKSSRGVTTRPFLQTFDLTSSRHVSRQALTRNNVTDFNVGPEKTPIIPPDVALLAISADGKWLATVDEWFPPGSDLEHTVSKSKSLDNPELRELKEQQEQRREVYLKFWLWDDEHDIWTLTTRVDAPHARSPGADVGAGAGPVLRLVSEPSGTGFATIGLDGAVKIWRPRSGGQSDSPDAETGGIKDWVCRHSVDLPVSTEVLGDRADSPLGMARDQDDSGTLFDACLSFSADGSLLACATGVRVEASVPEIHFVSPTQGTVVVSKAGLAVPGQALLDFGFIDRYFVSLTEGAVRVWNLVDDTHHYTITFPGTGLNREDALLAINPNDDTFAVVVFDEEQYGVQKEADRLSIYSPRENQCLFETVLDAKPEAILVGKRLRGYTLIFDDNTIRTLAPPARRRMLLSTTYEESLIPGAEAEQMDVTESGPRPDTTSNGLAIFDGASSHTRSGRAAHDDSSENDQQVVRPEQVDAIFGGGHRLSVPPVQDMFHAVVDLFARKPLKALPHADEEMDIDV